MGVKVAKFGGSSLADASQFYKVKAIIEADQDRRYVVPSAPGRRCDTDEKVTDMLYQCQSMAANGKDFIIVFNKIKERYIDIARELNLKINILAYLDKIESDIRHGATAAYAASRGEYLCGLLLADYLGYDFIDAAEVICFRNDGVFDSEKTNEILLNKIKNIDKAVIPGFYGAYSDGRINTFSRGGSDVSGAIVARAVGAEIYENWTDVSGFLMADPRIVPNPLEIDYITYQELRELSYMGASVLHEDSIFPVHRAGITTNIRNTNKPEHPGTLIEFKPRQAHSPHTITGIAGKKGFAVITVEKAMMNAELGFGRKVLQALEEKNISFEHLPTGIDTMCVVVQQEALAPWREEIVNRIIELTEPDTVTVQSDMALIATVGRGMVHNCGTAARLFGAMSRAGVNVRMIDQGSSELSIIVGVNDGDMAGAMGAIYEEFVNN